jgi:uncharacterized protein YndB with AHSA1/START domain
MIKVMNKQQFRISISADAATVWHALFDDESYSKWTKVFSPGSKAVTDWKEGSKVLFVDGTGGGMVSRIEKVRENELMQIHHIGLIKDGKEITDTPEAKEWDGTETYRLKPSNSGTDLEVELQFAKISQEFIDYFESTFPKALEELRKLAEAAVPAR